MHAIYVYLPAANNFIFNYFNEVDCLKTENKHVKVKQVT